MASATMTAPAQLGARRIDDLLPRVSRGVQMAFVVGALLTLLSFVVPAFRERVWATYLAAFTFYLGITLGGLFFVVLQHLVRAGWSVVVRRVAEGIALNTKLLPVLFIPVAIGTYQGHLHPAAAAHADHGDGHGAAHAPADPGHAAPGGAHAPAAPAHGAGHGAGHHAPHAPLKAKWLSFPWFLGRMLLFFAIWYGIASYFYGSSVAQDQDGDPARTSRMTWWAAPLMIVFALTCSLAGFDLLMALDPYWYSTMFGVYFFAGCFLSFMATLIIAFYVLRRHGLAWEVGPEHYHDMGKFMFAFVVFWAYVAYSQFMLIWYGNIPEETVWYLRRMEHGWLLVSAWLIVGHFVIPFLALLSRFPKRRPELLVAGSAWVLFVHYIDLQWLILPQPEAARAVPVPLLDLGLLLVLGAVYVRSTAANLTGVSLIPERDPRLRDSLAHENF